MNLRVVRRIVRSETFYALAILVGVLHICFFSCIWGNKSLLASAQDVPSVMPTGAFAGPPSAHRFGRTLDNAAGGIQGEPSLVAARYFYFHERTIPLWTPYQGYGRPFAANQLSQPFYPLTMALLAHISPRTYSWFILARLLVAGMGCYLYLSFFVSFWPRIAGGVTSMLAGYYLLFLTATQLSVEVLVPASLWAAEYLVRKRTYWSVVGFAVMLLIVFLGGMPESALVLFTLQYAYILFRIFSDSTLRASWLTGMARLAAATGAGIALSLFYLLPFQELMNRAFDTHQAHNAGGFRGLAHEAFGLSFWTYFFPLLHGPPTLTQYGPRNYAALTVVFLGVVAVAAALSKRAEKSGPLRPLTWFFTCSAAVIVCKRYGVLINSLGALPLYQMIDFPKYEESLLSVCLAILAGIGLERLVRGEVSGRKQAIAFAAAFLLIPAALWVSRQALTNELVNLHIPQKFSHVAMIVPASAMICVLLVCVLLKRSGPGLNSRLGLGITILLTAETCLNFVLPIYHWYYKLPKQAHDPYLGAPYVAVMKREAGNYRVFARDNLLFPIWSSAFQLNDIRDLDGMYDSKYLPFIRNFFQDQKNLDLQFDLGIEFNGIGNYSITTPLVTRLLQLSSVKYIATIRPFKADNRMVGETFSQNKNNVVRGREINVQRRGFILDGEARDVLGEHPPFERLPYRIRVGDGPQAIFNFSYALDPAVFDKTGDGVEFIVELKDSSGRITKQFSQYIDPKHNVQQRHWLDGELDLRRYRGQTVDLLFTTTAGPKGDSAYDWAGWSNFHFQGEDATEGPALPPMKVIYNGEAIVYRFDNILPRAAIYHHAQLVPEEKAVLQELANPALDIFQSVVLNESELSPDQRRSVEEMNSQAQVKVQTASIKSYRSREVEIEASLDRSGILVLNDSSYPGWLVDVDGHPAKWINANYLFRGVLLPPGKHSVRFVYRPQSFYLGAEVSGTTFAGLLIGGIAVSRRRRRTTAGSPG